MFTYWIRFCASRFTLITRNSSFPGVLKLDCDSGQRNDSQSKFWNFKQKSMCSFFSLGLNLISKSRGKDSRISEVPSTSKMLRFLKNLHHTHAGAKENATIPNAQRWYINVGSISLHHSPYKWPLFPFLSIQILSSSIIPSHGPLLPEAFYEPLSQM